MVSHIREGLRIVHNAIRTVGQAVNLRIIYAVHYYNLRWYMTNATIFINDDTCCHLVWSDISWKSNRTLYVATEFIYRCSVTVIAGDYVEFHRCSDQRISRLL
ncbi:hypothetical protein D3C74_389690 [compost metagenome]